MFPWKSNENAIRKKSKYQSYISFNYYCSVTKQMLLLRLLIFVRVIKHFLFDCDIDLQWSLPPSDCFNECLSDLAMSVQRMRDACEGEKKSPTTILNNQKMALSQCYFNTWKNCDACLKSEWPLDRNGENCWILANSLKKLFCTCKNQMASFLWDFFILENYVKSSCWFHN